MKRLIFIFFIISPQFSYAGLSIEGGISNNGKEGVSIGVDGTGSGQGQGGNGTGIIIKDKDQSNSSSEQTKKAIYSSICSSPFMKKYASICQ